MSTLRFRTWAHGTSLRHRLDVMAEDARDRRRAASPPLYSAAEILAARSVAAEMAWTFRAHLRAARVVESERWDALERGDAAAELACFDAYNTVFGMRVGSYLVRDILAANGGAP